MKEVYRIVVGLVALRITQDEDQTKCEMFEEGKWIELIPKRVFQLASDKRISDWLVKYYPQYTAKDSE